MERFEWNRVPEKGKWFKSEFWDSLSGWSLFADLLLLILQLIAACF